MRNKIFDIVITPFEQAIINCWGTSDYYETLQNIRMIGENADSDTFEKIVNDLEDKLVKIIHDTDLYDYIYEDSCRGFIDANENGLCLGSIKISVSDVTTDFCKAEFDMEEVDFDFFNE